MSVFRKISLRIFYSSLMILIPQLSAGLDTSGTNPYNSLIPITSITTIEDDFTPYGTRYKINAEVQLLLPMSTETFQAGVFGSATIETIVTWDPSSRVVSENTKILSYFIQVPLYRSEEWPKNGDLTAQCPADPVIFGGDCIKAVYSGLYNNTGKLKNIKGQLISRNVLTEEQKASLRHKHEITFAPPEILKPSPNEIYGVNYQSSGEKYQVPVFVALLYNASIQLEIREISSNEKPLVIERILELADGTINQYGMYYDYAPVLDAGRYEITATPLNVPEEFAKPSKSVQFLVGSVDSKDLDIDRQMVDSSSKTKEMSGLEPSISKNIPKDRSSARGRVSEQNMIAGPVPLDPDNARSSDELFDAGKMALVPENARDERPVNDQLQTADGSMLSKFGVQIREPSQEMVYNNLDGQGNVAFKYWLISDDKVDLELKIEKGNETVVEKTIPKTHLKRSFTYNRWRPWEIIDTLPMPPGKYSISARPLEPAGEAWSGPVSFYLGQGVVLPDSAKTATLTDSGAFSLRSGSSPLPGESPKDLGTAKTPEFKESAFKTPTIVKPADRQSFVTAGNQDKCIMVEIKHLPSSQAFQQTPVLFEVAWRVYVQMQFSPSTDDPYSRFGTWKQTPGEEPSSQKEYCLAPGRYRLRTWAQEYDEAQMWVEKEKHYGDWQEFAIMPFRLKSEIPVAGPVAPGQIPKEQKKADVLRSNAARPTLMPLGKANVFRSNSMTSLSVKHAAGQKPLFEFETFDGKRWRRSQEIRLINMQTPKASSGLVVTKASVRMTAPGKFRYRVKMNEPGATPTPYRELVVEAQRLKKKTVAEQPAAPVKNKSARTSVKKSETGKSAKTQNIPAPQRKMVLTTPPTPPAISAPRPGQTFNAPADIMLKARYNQNFPIKFELQKDNGRYVTIDSSQLTELQAGKYHVRARYEGKNPGSPVAFTVKMPIKRRAAKVQ